MKRTGVIVPMERDVTPEQARMIRDELRTMFPSVKFALMTGGLASAVFEYDDGVDFTDPIVFDPEWTA